MAEQIKLSMEALNKPIERIIDPAYKEAFDNAVAKHRGQVAFWAAAVSAPFWATGFILDIFIYPDFYWDLFFIRFGSFILLGIASLLFPPNASKNHPILTLYTNMGICSLALSIIITVTGDKTSPYLIAYMLFFAGASTVLNLKSHEALIGAVIVCATFLVPAILNEMESVHIFGVIVHGCFLTAWTLLASRIMTVLLYNNLLASHALEQLSKEKDEMVSNISHEFRTPITLMVSPIDSIRANLDDKTAVDHYLSVAKSEGLRLLRQVNNMLDYIAILNKGEGTNSLNLTTSNLSKIIDDNLASFELFARQKGLQFWVNDQTTKPVVGEFDIREIDKVFSNVLMNAIKYTNAGRIEVTITNDDAELVFKVLDTGVGINENEISSLFERLRKGSRTSNSGSGIGLYLTKTITEAHSGSIEIKSKPDQGSVVTIRLPITKSSDNVTPITMKSDIKPSTNSLDSQANRAFIVEQSDEKNPLSGKALSIMIVDDEINMRRFLKDMFTDNFNVFTATNCHEATVIAKSNHIDLAILDYMLPDGTGVTLAREFRSSAPNMKLIMLTASKDKSIEREASEIVDHFYVKPFDRGSLIKCAAGLLNTETDSGGNLIASKADIKALVIENNMGVAQMIYGCFGAGVDVSIARSADQARETLKQYTPDIITIDDGLGDDRGIELAKELKEWPKLKDCRFIVVSGDTDIETRVSALELCDDYISKPFDQRELTFRLKNHVKESVLKRDLRIKNAQIENQNSTLVQHEKLAAIGELSMTFTHEVRNALNYTKGPLEFLKMSNVESMSKDDLLEIIDDMKTGIDQIESITNSLKTFKQAKTNNDYKEVNLELALSQAIKFSVPKPSAADVQVICPNLNVWGEESQLIQVFSNLIVNSLSAFDENQSEKRIVIDCKKSKGHVVIHFSDNGPGIPEENAVRLFDKFYTTKISKDGTGLGLSIAKVIIEAHHGEIRFVGNNPGAEFEIRLPIS